MTNKRRRAETLAEILMGLFIFGLLMGGISDFIANQTLQVARIKDRDKLIYNEQKLMALGQRLLELGLVEKLKTNKVIAGNPSTYPSTTFNINGTNRTVEYIEENIVSFDWYKENKKILTTLNNITSVDINLE